MQNKFLKSKKSQVTAFNDSTSALNASHARSSTTEPKATISVTVENKAVTKVAVETQTAQTVRVKFDQLDKLMNLVGELVINKIALLQVTADNHN